MNIAMSELCQPKPSWILAITYVYYVPTMSVIVSFYLEPCNNNSKWTLALQFHVNTFLLCLTLWLYHYYINIRKNLYYFLINKKNNYWKMYILCNCSRGYKKYIYGMKCWNVCIWSERTLCNLSWRGCRGALFAIYRLYVIVKSCLVIYGKNR